VTILAPAATTVVEVAGADRLSYLEAVTSQHLLDAEPGDVRGAMHLDPHGAPLAVFDVVVLADRSLLLLPDDELAVRVVEVLGGRTFLSDARFARRDDVVVALRGEDAPAIAAGAGLPDGPRASEVDGLVVVPRPGGLDLVGAPGALEPLRDRLVEAGATPADEEELEAWCVEHGEPRWGREVAAPHLPEELGLLPTHVHLAKGCYPGQEAVARMWMLGRPRRRLARVALDPGVGEGWRAGSGKRSVAVTAAAGDRGLAFVPADAEAGQRLTSDEDDRGVTVLGFVGDGLDVPGHDPRVTRRRDRR
jgi:folate-binding protein YgfZ